MKKLTFIYIFTLVLGTCLYACRQQIKNNEKVDSQSDTSTTLQLSTEKDTSIASPYSPQSEMLNDTSVQNNLNSKKSASSVKNFPNPENPPPKKITDKVELQYDKVLFLIEKLESECKASQKIDSYTGLWGAYHRMKVSWIDSSLAYRMRNQEYVMKNLKIIEKEVEALLKNCEKR